MVTRVSQEDDLPIDVGYLRRLLEEMIKIPSVVGEEKTFAFFLEEEVKKLGLQTELERVEFERFNLYAVRSFHERGKTLTFNGHLDTVESCSGWETDPFSPMLRGQELYGLGSLDMKSGLACELAAIKALVNSNLELAGTIHFTAVVDEEGYGKGARKMLHNPSFGKGRTDGILIAEPFFGDNETNALPLGMTGKVLYKITIHGRSAHAFTPAKGINAIDVAGKIIASLQEQLDSSPKKPLFVLPSDNAFGSGTMCFLKVVGGYKVYSVVVPDRCELILNRLLIPGETKESALKDLQEFLLQLDLPAEVTLELVPPFYVPYKLPQATPLVASLAKSYQAIFGFPPQFNYRKMITDANIFYGEGKIPTVLFGPKGGNIHAANEYVDLSLLSAIAQIYCQLFLSFQNQI
ncbi:MAG: M20/M25/M40 family metallo-hydrolase [Candidatus Heimdallarchaeota archaeon]|nr:M20/M25/M40 family metallo-hydrolase [Candidatus Heimdallarchaeota archaeon]